MKTISALELRAHVGQHLDAAAAGERIVIERAGQPLCALVPLSDLEAVDPTRVRERRLAALASLRRLAKQYPVEPGDTAEVIRRMRADRDAQIMRAVEDGRRRREEA